MELSQKVAFNTLVQIFTKIATVIFGLLTTILLTNYLGREGYGDYMYVITLAIVFGAFADWGTAIIGVREASKEKEKQGQILANVFLVRLFLALLAALLLVLTSVLLPVQTSNPILLRQTIALGGLIVILIATKTSFSIVFQTKLEMQNLAAADIIGSFLTFFISWLFVRLKFGLLSLVVAVISATTVAVIIAGILAWRMVKFNFEFDKRLVKKLLSESLPMGAILLLYTIDNKIDTVMLGSIEGSGSVGIYAIAYRIYDVLILGAAYLMNALLPVISAYSDLNRYENRLKRIYQKAFDVLLLMGVGVVLLTWFFAPLVVKILTQQRFIEFADSILVLRILILALFFSYFNHLTGYTIIALGKQRPYFLIALSALIFNVFTNSLVIPRFSYFGAAAVTILTEVLILLMSFAMVFRLIKIVPSIIQFPKTAIQLIRRKGKIF